MCSKLEVADIFRRHGDTFRAAQGNRLSLDQRKVMAAIEACRTSALGGHVERCEDCGEIRVAYNSCRDMTHTQRFRSSQPSDRIALTMSKRRGQSMQAKKVAPSTEWGIIKLNASIRKLPKLPSVSSPAALCPRAPSERSPPYDRPSSTGPSVCCRPACRLWPAARLNARAG